VGNGGGDAVVVLELSGEPGGNGLVGSPGGQFEEGGDGVLVGVFGLGEQGLGEAEQFGGFAGTGFAEDEQASLDVAAVEEGEGGLAGVDRFWRLGAAEGLQDAINQLHKRRRGWRGIFCNQGQVGLADALGLFLSGQVDFDLFVQGEAQALGGVALEDGDQLQAQALLLGLEGFGVCGGEVFADKVAGFSQVASQCGNGGGNGDEQGKDGDAAGNEGIVDDGFDQVFDGVGGGAGVLADLG